MIFIYDSPWFHGHSNQINYEKYFTSFYLNSNKDTYSSAQKCVILNRTQTLKVVTIRSKLWTLGSIYIYLHFLHLGKSIENDSEILLLYLTLTFLPRLILMCLSQGSTSKSYHSFAKTNYSSSSKIIRY